MPIWCDSPLPHVAVTADVTSGPAPKVAPQQPRNESQQTPKMHAVAYAHLLDRQLLKYERVDHRRLGRLLRQRALRIRDDAEKQQA